MHICPVDGRRMMDGGSPEGWNFELDKHLEINCLDGPVICANNGKGKHEKKCKESFNG